MRKIGFKELNLRGKTLLKPNIIKLFLTPQESDAIYMRKKINIFHVPFHRIGGMREGKTKQNKNQNKIEKTTKSTHNYPSQKTTKELIRPLPVLGNS